MQIERTTRRWPYVAALMLLLVLCWTIPFYWHSGGRRAEERRPGDRPPTAGDIAYASARDYLTRHARDGSRATLKLPRTVEDDRIEKLLVELSRPTAFGPNATHGGAVGNPDLLSDFFADVSKTSASPPTPLPAPPEPAVPGPYVTAALERAGQELIRLSPHRLANSATRMSLSVGRAIAKNTLQRTAPTIRLTDPNDRLALAPPRRPQPKIVAQVEPLSAPPPETAVVPKVAAADTYPTPWCSPTSLLDQLEFLADQPDAAEWAGKTIDQLRQLTDADRLSNDDMAGGLHRLNDLAAEAVALAEGAREDRLRGELLRAHWGLVRRLECWKLMQQITVASAGANRFAARVPASGQTHRLSGAGTQPVDLKALSSGLEAYEQSRAPRLARAIAQQQRQLAESPDASQRALANQIDQHYRNSNMRVALSAELLSRFLSQPEPELRPVHDRIAGTPVHGRSQTVAKSRVRLEPRVGRWQVDLEVDGTVESDTVADGGPAKLRSHGSTQFSAQKSIVVATDGVHVGPSRVGAESQTRLVGVRSSFDWIPIIGDIVRSQAVDQYRKKRPRARAEVEYKVARRVERQLDARTRDTIEQAEQQVRDRLTGPLEKFGVTLTPVELTTTSQRVIARLRLAGDEQLAGHTPRPRAPADSLGSLQVHESAFTNAALALELEGRQLTAPELQQLLRNKIPRLRRQVPIEVEEGTVFHFADRDAVSFRVAEGRLELILAMAKVERNGRAVRDFRVHALYLPVIDGIEAELVRDGALGIEGRLRTADRARLHGVFNKVLSEDRRIPIIQLTDAIDRRFADLMITQLVLEDGWLGLAVGPRYQSRTAKRSRMLR